MNIRRVPELFRRLPLLTALRFAVVELVRRVLLPETQLSFSSAGEDVVFKWFTDGQPNIYVDVGCNRPFRASNTALLYTRGWSGLAVDGNATLIADFQRNRPRDKAICAVVSDVEEEVEFSVMPDDDLSGIGRSPNAKSVVKTRSRRLDSLLAEAGIKKVDLLSIDVEGHDMEVLRSFDINGQHRPRIILIELLNFDVERSHDFPAYRHLTENGYSLKSYAVLTALFSDRRCRP